MKDNRKTDNRPRVALVASVGILATAIGIYLGWRQAGRG